jgi:hypothetical protein
MGLVPPVAWALKAPLPHPFSKEEDAKKTERSIHPTSSRSRCPRTRDLGPCQPDRSIGDPEDQKS